MFIYLAQKFLRPLALLLTCLASVHCSILLAATPIIEISIKDHLFFPAEIEVPANTKIKLLIKNLDSTPEEFESYELNREKVIVGNSKTIVFIGPLLPGEYPFFGDLFPKTAQGKIIVRQPQEKP